MDATDDLGREAIDDVLDVLTSFLEETLVVLDVGDDLEVDLQYRDGEIVGDLDGDRDDIALIIGKRGQTLDAVQYLANAVVSAQCEQPIPVTIDAQGYRLRRAGQLEKLADRAVAEAMRDDRSVELEPMTASERKVVHLYLKDHPDVETSSAGRDPHRRVTVFPRTD
jgi:spoIIIJ-associated protein